MIRKTIWADTVQNSAVASAAGIDTDSTTWRMLCAVFRAAGAALVGDKCHRCPSNCHKTHELLKHVARMRGSGVLCKKHLRETCRAMAQANESGIASNYTRYAHNKRHKETQRRSKVQRIQARDRKQFKTNVATQMKYPKLFKGAFCSCICA